MITQLQTGQGRMDGNENIVRNIEERLKKPRGQK